jgi:hypothetical protein
MARFCLVSEYFLSHSISEQPLCVVGFCNKPASFTSYILTPREGDAAMLLHVLAAILFW